MEGHSTILARCVYWIPIRIRIRIQFNCFVVIPKLYDLHI